MSKNAERHLSKSGQLRTEIVNTLFTELRNSLRKSRSLEDGIDRAMAAYDASSFARAIRLEYALSVDIIQHDKLIARLIPENRDQDYLLSLERQAKSDLKRVSDIERRLDKRAREKASMGIYKLPGIDEDVIRVVFALDVLLHSKTDHNMLNLSEIMKTPYGVQKPSKAIDAAAKLGLISVQGSGNEAQVRYTQRGINLRILYNDLRSEESFS